MLSAQSVHTWSWLSPISRGQYFIKNREKIPDKWDHQWTFCNTANIIIKMLVFWESKKVIILLLNSWVIALIYHSFLLLLIQYSLLLYFCGTCHELRMGPWWRDITGECDQWLGWDETMLVTSGCHLCLSSHYMPSPIVTRLTGDTDTTHSADRTHTREQWDLTWSWKSRGRQRQRALNHA